MTNQEKYLENFKAITEEMYAITKAKNSDYTGDTSDPFKNFTMVETMGVATAEQGFFTRMNDKMMRFAGFIKNGTLQVTSEKIEDTLMDLAVYCILCICYLRSRSEEDARKDVLTCSYGCGLETTSGYASSSTSKFSPNEN